MLLSYFLWSLWIEEKPRNKKELGWTPPFFDRSHPRGRGPFVPWNCPVCPLDILSNPCGSAQKSGCDVPDIPGLAPKPSFRGTPTSEFLCVFFVYRYFLLPIYALLLVFCHLCLLLLFLLFVVVPLLVMLFDLHVVRSGGVWFFGNVCASVVVVPNLPL